jgi:hypothetical protein
MANNNLAEKEKRKVAFIEEMNLQTDRGVAIVGAAWVEDEMALALESILASEPNVWKRLFEGAGPLATFSAKIDLARLLGLITDAIRSDLHIIRDIRNEFAHQVAHKTDYTKLSFQSAHLKDKCMALKCIAHRNYVEPRIAFINACSILNWDFEMLRFYDVKITSDGAHIFAQVEKQ